MGLPGLRGANPAAQPARSRRTGQTGLWGQSSKPKKPRAAPPSKSGKRMQQRLSLHSFTAESRQKQGQFERSFFNASAGKLAHSVESLRIMSRKARGQRIAPRELVFVTMVEPAFSAASSLLTLIVWVLVLLFAVLTIFETTPAIVDHTGPTP